MIREQFTIRQLNLYAERFSARYKKQNDEKTESSEHGASWKKYITGLRASGEVEYVRGE